jgi:hypothetical protein
VWQPLAQQWVLQATSKCVGAYLHCSLRRAVCATSREHQPCMHMWCPVLARGVVVLAAAVEGLASCMKPGCAKDQYAGDMGRPIQVAMQVCLGKLTWA